MVALVLVLTCTMYPRFLLSKEDSFAWIFFFLNIGSLHVSAVRCRLILDVSSNFSVACSLPVCTAWAVFDTWRSVAPVIKWGLYGKWTDCGGLILWPPKSPDLIPVDTLIQTTRQSGFNSSRAQRFFSLSLPSDQRWSLRSLCKSIRGVGGWGSSFPVVNWMGGSWPLTSV